MAGDYPTMVIGWVAAACTTLSFVPQLVKIRRQGGRDLSDGMLLLYLLGLGLWLAYGIRIRAVEVVSANTVGGVLVLAALVSKRRHATASSSPRAPQAGPTLADPGRRAEIVRRIRALTPDSKRRWGRMSVGQMVCHLADSNRMALGERQVATDRLPIPGVILKWVSLYAPLPWPSGLPTSRELDPQAQGTAPTDLPADVAVLEATVERLAASVERTEWPRHPLFGAMSANDWLRWAYLHMDHHLRQFGV